MTEPDDNGPRSVTTIPRVMDIDHDAIDDRPPRLTRTILPPVLEDVVLRADMHRIGVVPGRFRRHPSKSGHTRPDPATSD